MNRVLLDTLITGLPLVPVFLGIYTVFRIRQDFDLTVEGSFAVGGASSAVALIHGAPPWVAVLAGALAGGACGLLTAGLHLLLNLPVMLAGLVMSIGLFSVTLHILGMPTRSLLGRPTIFDPFGPGTDDATMTVVLAAVVAIVLFAYALFLRTDIGLSLRTTGVNAAMARSHGVNDRALLALSLFLANAMAGFGSGLAVQTQGYADVNMGVGMFVSGVGALLLGELLLRPSGSRVVRIVLCVLAGTLGYRLILTAALRIGLPAGDLKGVTALTLVAAVTTRHWLGAGLRRLRTRTAATTIADLLPSWERSAR